MKKNYRKTDINKPNKGKKCYFCEMETPVRKIIKYKHYFDEFNNKLSESVQRKIEFTLDVIRYTNKVPEKFLKHISGSKGLFEVRVGYQGNIYRIFTCFDEGRLVVLMNGFQKKSQKTPKEEIKLAEKIMKDYFEDKGRFLKQK